MALAVAQAAEAHAVAQAAEAHAVAKAAALAWARLAPRKSVMVGRPPDASPHISICIFLCCS